MKRAFSIEIPVMYTNRKTNKSYDFHTDTHHRARKPEVVEKKRAGLSVFPPNLQVVAKQFRKSA